MGEGIDLLVRADGEGDIPVVLAREFVERLLLGDVGGLLGGDLLLERVGRQRRHVDGGDLRLRVGAVGFEFDLRGLQAEQHGARHVLRVNHLCGLVDEVVDRLRCLLNESEAMGQGVFSRLRAVHTSGIAAHRSSLCRDRSSCARQSVVMPARL